MLDIAYVLIYACYCAYTCMIQESYIEAP